MRLQMEIRWLYMEKILRVKNRGLLYRLKEGLIFDNTDQLSSSRWFFVLEGITGIGQFSLTTGAFLAGFISFLGGSESINGILGVVPAAAGLFQLFASLIRKEGQSRKQLIVQWATFLRIFLSIVYFVPFLFMKLGASEMLVLGSFVVCFIFAFILNALIAPYVGSWLIDLVPMRIRGKYLAMRDRISLTVIAMCTIGLGKVLDINKSLGDEFRGFLVVGLVLVVMGFLNLFALHKIEDVEVSEDKVKKPFRNRIIQPIKDPVFLKLIRFNGLWNFALFIGGPFIAVYMVEELKLSYTYMMTMTVIGTIVRVLFTSFWGKVADHRSWMQSAGLSLLVLGITHFSWSIVSSENAFFMVPLLNILGGIAWAGVAISIFNLQFMYADQKIRTISLGVNAAFGGLVGLMAVWIGGRIVKYVNVHMAFALSGILLILCTGYIFLVLSKNEVRNNG